jgi:hypothetical protein
MLIEKKQVCLNIRKWTGNIMRSKGMSVLSSHSWPEEVGVERWKYKFTCNRKYYCSNRHCSRVFILLACSTGCFIGTESVCHELGWWVLCKQE